MNYKRKSVYAYLDGNLLCNVTQCALDNNMFVSDLKEILIKENPDNEITFKVK
jgi:hypothetical protein